MKDDDQAFEDELRELVPAKLDPILWDSALQEDRSDESRDVVPGSETEAVRPFAGIGHWAMAALFCLLGVACVWLLQDAFTDFGPSADSHPQQLSRVADAIGDQNAGELPSIAGSTFQPVGLRRLFVDARDDGVVSVVGDVPYRQVRYQLLDRFEWNNPRDGSEIQMIVPREEIFLLPVVTY